MIIDSTMCINDGNSTKLYAKNGPLMDLLTKGCAVPDPVRVTYNRGTKTVYKTKKDGSFELDKNGKRIKLREYPILTTIVNWATGEKTIVQNSESDGLILNKDGTPSLFSKECGFVFALAKRVLAGKINENDQGELIYSDHGFGTALGKIIEQSIDQQEFEAKCKEEKKLSAQRRLESEKKHAAKAGTTEPSLKQCVKGLTEVINTLKSDINTQHAVSKKPAVKKAIKATTTKKHTTK